MLALLIADSMALRASPEVMVIVAVVVPTLSSRGPAAALGAPAVERSTDPVVTPAVENGADCACCTVDSACCNRLVMPWRPLVAALIVCRPCPI